MSNDAQNRPIRVAAIQPDLVYGHPSENLDLIRRTVAGVVSDGPVDLVVLPEMFEGDRNPSDGSRATRFLCELAREYDTHIVGGSCDVVGPASQRNTCYVVHRAGEVVGQYDKRVLFSDETDSASPGHESGVFELDSVRVGVLICADMWHPELAREMLDRIDVLAVPARTGVRTEAHVAYARILWHSMALTRAMENGFAVVVADWPRATHQIPHADGPRIHPTAGATTIVDPSHRPNIEQIQRTIDPARPDAISATVDLAALAAYRTYRQSVGLLSGPSA